MARVFPTHATCWRITHLLRDADPSSRALRASSRLLELAPGLPHGSHLTLVLAGDGDKRVSIELHADTDAKVTQADIDHVAEGCAVVTPIVNRPVPLPVLSDNVGAAVPLSIATRRYIICVYGGSKSGSGADFVVSCNDSLCPAATVSARTAGSGYRAAVMPGAVR